jgi:hypothetical protein
MHTITNLARKSGEPRRSVQYWHDKGVIEPLSRDPLVYSDDELVLVRILAALTQSKPAIQIVTRLGELLHLCMVSDETVPADVRGAFEAAERRESAYFGISWETKSDGESYFPWTFGATSELDLHSAISRHLDRNPNLGLTIVNLTYCYDLKRQVGPSWWKTDVPSCRPINADRAPDKGGA